MANFTIIADGKIDYVGSFEDANRHGAQIRKAGRRVVVKQATRADWIQYQRNLHDARKQDVNAEALKVDREANADASDYTDLILSYVRANPGATAYEMYSKLKLADVPMYLALHELVGDGRMFGPDPYDDVPPDMSLWHYTA